MKLISLKRIAALLTVALFTSFITPKSQAQTPTPRWDELTSFDYSIWPDIEYSTFSSTALRLDVWQNRAAKTPAPTLVYYHGGGWMIGSKANTANMFLPYIARGWNVVSVDYRMGGTALAPAAVEDSRCALRWVFNNHEKYNFDTSRIVLSGHSAGGHLALIVGMLPDGTDLDSQCPSKDPMHVAAIVNWYGITDVPDILSGPHLETYAVSWLGAQANKLDIAKQVSPVTYVRKDLPPILTVHGDKDQTVPYSQAIELKDALDKAGVTNQLITMPGGGHGGFEDQPMLNAFDQIWKFLDQALKSPAHKP